MGDLRLEIVDLRFTINHYSLLTKKPIIIPKDNDGLFILK